MGACLPRKNGSQAGRAKGCQFPPINVFLQCFRATAVAAHSGLGAVGVLRSPENGLAPAARPPPAQLLPLLTTNTSSLFRRLFLRLLPVRSSASPGCLACLARFSPLFLLRFSQRRHMISMLCGCVASTPATFFLPSFDSLSLFPHTSPLLLHYLRVALLCCRDVC